MHTGFCNCRKHYRMLALQAEGIDKGCSVVDHLSLEIVDLFAVNSQRGTNLMDLECYVLAHILDMYLNNMSFYLFYIERAAQ